MLMLLWWRNLPGCYPRQECSIFILKTYLDQSTQYNISIYDFLKLQATYVIDQWIEKLKALFLYNFLSLSSWSILFCVFKVASLDCIICTLKLPWLYFCCLLFSLTNLTSAPSICYLPIAPLLFYKPPPSHSLLYYELVDLLCVKLKILDYSLANIGIDI